MCRTRCFKPAAAAMDLTACNATQLLARGAPLQYRFLRGQGLAGRKDGWVGEWVGVQCGAAKETHTIGFDAKVRSSCSLYLHTNSH